MGGTIMVKKEINIGDKYFRWTVIGESAPIIRPNGRKRRIIQVKCDCGEERDIIMEALISGRSKSCGCYSSEQKHLRKKMIYGIGVNDIDSLINQDINTEIYYNIWHRMIRRCYSKASLKLKPTYSDCQVCLDWLHFSSFKKWCESNYINDYELDKDVLCKGNKIYRPDTCCFIPHKINVIFSRKKREENLPIGVHYHIRDKVYESSVNIYGKLKHLGTFNTPEAAFYAYKESKEKYIKEVAQDYYDKRLIKQNVYEALMKYEVEITD